MQIPVYKEWPRSIDIERWVQRKSVLLDGALVSNVKGSEAKAKCNSCDKAWTNLEGAKLLTNSIIRGLEALRHSC